MPKFRKKPVVIEAEQYFFEKRDHPFFHEAGVRSNHNYSYIPTLEGKMEISEGDWIIKGVKGEYYPCKPDIFEATYDSAD